MSATINPSTTDPEIALAPIATPQQRYHNASSSNPRRRVPFRHGFLIMLPGLSGIIRILLLFLGGALLKRFDCGSRLLMTAFDTNAAFIPLDLLAALVMIAVDRDLHEQSSEVSESVKGKLRLLAASNTLILWAAVGLIVAVQAYRKAQDGGKV